MNQDLDFLLQRASCARLADPAPSAEELEPMFAAAMRAPDHARLRPWRFLCVRGERRVELGHLFRKALLARDPAADSAAQDKAANAPLRAPLLVIAIASISAHPKVPPIEQRLAAGCATYGLLLAAEASGYAGIWRTGEVAFDRTVMDALGLAANEEIIGFLYLGTREGDCRALPRLAVDDYVAEW